MKKTLFILSFAIFGMYAINNSANAQLVYFEDNFDSYTAGQPLVGQDPTTPWRTWSQPTDPDENPLVSTEQFQTSPNSVKMMGDNDLYFPFAEQPTSGMYSIEFDYYIPSTGNGGYFNVQHMNEPGIQWACEIYFRNNGTGYMIAGSSTQIPFNYGGANRWFHIYMEIDLDNDEASLEIDGNLVQIWPFHYQANNPNGINQLGGVNIYAGAPNNLSGTYYFDNFRVLILEESNEGTFVVEPKVAFDVDLEAGEVFTKTFSVSNPGGNPVYYKVVPTYLPEVPILTMAVPTQVSYHQVKDYTLSVWFQNTAEYTVAMGLPSSTLGNHIGKQLTQLQIEIVRGQNALSAKLVVYKMKYEYEYMPSLDLIYQQSFTPVTGENTLNTINLTTPVLIDGSDLWVGVVLTQTPTTVPDNATSILLDSETGYTGYPDENSGFFRTAGNWSNLGEGWGNYIMTATINGTQVVPGKWIVAEPESGTLEAGDEIDVVVTFGRENITTLIPEFNGAINFISSDFMNQHVPVNFSVNKVILEAPEITTTTLPDGKIGMSYNATIQATGTPTPTFSLVGVLPDGLTLSSAGVISGIPTIADTFTFEVKAINEIDEDIKEFTINILGAGLPFIVTESLPDGFVDEEYLAELEADCDVTWSLLESDLPDGLELSEDGIISGIPTTEGKITFTIVATNENGFTTKDFTIDISTVGISGKSVQTLSAYIQNGTMHVNGLTVGEKWSVYTMAGTLIYENVATGVEATTSVRISNGVYIVKSGKNTISVMF